MSRQGDMPRELTRLLLGVTVALALLAVGLTFSAVAVAGGYDVHACDASYANGANRSWAPIASTGMTAFVDCPAGRGLTARNVYDGGRSLGFQGAFLVFDSPPGTALGGISFVAGWERADCSWNVGVSRGDGSLVWGFASSHACDSANLPGPTNFLDYRWAFPLSGGSVRIQAVCGASTCPRAGTNAIRLRDVTVHVNDDVAPVLSGGRGALWTSSGWLSGTQSVGFDASDGAGIRESAVLVDGREVAHQNFGCDYTQRAPCPSGASLDKSFNSAGFGEGRHLLALQSVDAAGNPSSVSRDILVDNSPPAPPEDVVVAGGDGWRSTNDFSLLWSPTTESGAPIIGAEWSLCSSTGTCVRGAHSQDAITSVEHLSVPSAGDWTARLWLRDAAGNQDARLAAPPVHLRFDDVSPELSLQPLSSDDPTLVRVNTSDLGSGVAGGSVEVRVVGTDQWLEIPTSLQGSTLVARIDDQRLREGDYELRARVTDRAGNERSTSTYASGAPARFSLPLRLATRLRVGIVRASHGSSRLARNAIVGYGSLVRVRGRVLTPEGNPMQDVEVQAYSKVQDGSTPQRLLATVKTSSTGLFSFLISRGPSRLVEIRYGGSTQIRGVVKELRLNVRAATSIRPDRGRLVNGEDVRFSGRIRTGRIPVKGKLVEMQVLVRGKWRTFATTRARRNGAWQYRYRFDGTRGDQEYRFRAKLPPEAGYPYAAGLSGVIHVHVHGL